MAGRPKRKTDLVTLDQVGEGRVEELLESAMPIAEVCRQLGVGKRVLYEWLEAAPGRAGLLSRARARAAHVLAEEALTIADETTGDVQRDRLRVDTRKWLAGKWNQAQFGDSKGAQVTINLGDLHLQAVKTVKPVHGADALTLEADDAPQQDGGERA
jgi:hypothetical protein